MIDQREVRNQVLKRLDGRLEATDEDVYQEIDHTVLKSLTVSISRSNSESR